MTATRLILVNVLIRIAAAAAGQLFAFVLAERMGDRAGAGSLLVGLIAAAFYMTELVGAPVVGRLADARGQIRVLRWGPAFGISSAVAGVAAANGDLRVAPLVAILLLARLTEGASAACAVPTTLALLARSSTGDASRRLRLMGVFEIASLAGMVLGFGIAGMGWDTLGARAFLAVAALYGAAWLLVHGSDSAVRRGMSRVAPIWRTIRTIAAKRGAVSFGIAWLAVNAVVGVWIQQAPYLMKLPVRAPSQALVGGYSGTTIGAIFAVWGVTFLIGIALWSIIAPRWPRRRILAAALLGMLVVVASLASVNHCAPRWVLIIAIAGVLVESGFTPAAFAHLADLTDARDASRGTVMGLYSLLLGAGQLAGATLGSPFAARWQMDGVLAVTALLAFAALGAVAWMQRESSDQL